MVARRGDSLFSFAAKLPSGGGHMNAKRRRGVEWVIPLLCRKRKRLFIKGGNSTCRCWPPIIIIITLFPLKSGEIAGNLSSFSQV